ncbi:MAG: type IV-A pilus assembly ATPase PilB [Acidobacteriota bacterium]|nr:type IV-A pilus assembly ATPase PilB [Thermoanaerobaculaceae bacterium]
MADRIGELLLKSGLINEQQLQEALKLQKTNGGKLGFNLVKLGYVKEEDITSLLSEQYGVPAIHLEHFDIEDEVLKLIPPDIAQKFLLIPIERTGATLTVAMADPSNIFAIDQIRFLTSYTIEPVVASEASIRSAIDKYYGGSKDMQLKDVMEEIEKVNEEAELEIDLDEEDMSEQALAAAGKDAPVIRLVNAVFADAIRKGASDIHIEPYEKDFRIRFRIDGLLYEQLRPPMKMKDGITSRIKIMAKLDIAEKRIPQDGRIKTVMKIDGKVKEIDYRVSTVPTLWGEKVVLRLLDKEGLKLDLTKLGFEPESLEKFQKAIAKPTGMILITGPTGSGKTNTLYSAIGQLNQPDKHILTAEDPVEFSITGCNQVQMKEDIGLTFAAALRSFLRQDPNIILVGEIRDFETAEIAVKAALTGHLVMSTLHTNDAPSSISRLVNMGIEPFLVGTAVQLIQAQRLVRRVCKDCKEEVSYPKKALLDMGFTEEEAETVKIYKGKGCPTCNGSGCKGRIALMEVLEMTETMREMVLMGANALDLKKQAISEGMITLRRSGLIKVMNGIVPIEEVLRETVL